MEIKKTKKKKIGIKSNKEVFKEGLAAHIENMGRNEEFLYCFRRKEKNKLVSIGF